MQGRYLIFLALLLCMVVWISGQSTGGSAYSTNDYPGWNNNYNYTGGSGSYGGSSTVNSAGSGWHGYTGSRSPPTPNSAGGGWHGHTGSGSSQTPHSAGSGWQGHTGSGSSTNTYSGSGSHRFTGSGAFTTPGWSGGNGMSTTGYASNNPSPTPLKKRVLHDRRIQKYKFIRWLYEKILRRQAQEYRK